MKFRTLLLGLTALFVAFNAAFFSVSGLSKLFAGASLSVIVMASSLELAKLITAGYLYNYWTHINKLLRTYLVGGVLILILITSMGIYGFLTSAFQDTYNQFNIKEKQITFLEQKESFWDEDVTRYDEELKRISLNISTLSNAKASSIQVRDTSSTTGFRNTISTTELRLSQKRIEVEEENRKAVQAKREVAADSLQSIQLKILELESMEGVSSELGPLQYLSDLLDRPMNQIINWLILTIIFVFDPLAVTLVVAFNNALMVDRGIIDKQKIIRRRELYDETPEEDDLSELSTAEQTLMQDRPEDVIESVEDLEVSEPIVLPEEPTPPKKKKTKKKRSKKLMLVHMGEPLITAAKNNEEFQGKPYYMHQNFEWGMKELWQNDTAAVKYWIANIKPNA